VTFEDFLRKCKIKLYERRHAYRTTFNGPLGREVLKDLAKFCHAHESTFHPDTRLSAVMQGKHDVFLRIAHHLNLTDQQLWSLYDGRESDVPS
jgi:hypothetical protein